jgi:ABC-2 type transport system ATP-binding protein
MPERTVASGALADAAGLVRLFGEHRAVDGVTLSLARGEVVGFVGKNGAGKSTTMKLLAGVLAPSVGSVRVTGHAASTAAARRNVGFAPEVPLLDPDLTVDEQLRYAASLRGIGGRAAALEISRVLSLCDVLAVRDQLTSSLSKGTRQRVGLAQALLGDPPLLLLDEPSSGLDPAQIEGLRKLLASLAESHAVLVSTHHVAEVLPVVTRVVALQRGRVVLDQTRAALGDDAERTILAALDVVPAPSGARA